MLLVMQVYDGGCDNKGSFYLCKGETTCMSHKYSSHTCKNGSHNWKTSSSSCVYEKLDNSIKNWSTVHGKKCTNGKDFDSMEAAKNECALKGAACSGVSKPI